MQIERPKFKRSLKEKSAEMHFGSIEAVAVIEKPVCSLTWRIKNFDRLKREYGVSISSPTFTVRNLRGSWRLHVYPGGRKSKNHVELYLERESRNGPTEICIMYELSFLTADGFPYVTGKCPRLAKNSKKYGIDHYPHQEEVFATKRSSCLPQNTLIVRCRLWDAISDNVRCVQCSARTEMIVGTVSHRWSIENFDKLELDDKRGVIISAPWNTGEKLCMELSIDGESTDEADLDIKVIPFFLPASVKCKMSLLDQSKNVVKSVQDEHSFDSANTIWSLPKFLTRQGLMERKEEFLFGNALLLHCEFSTLLQHDLLESGSSNFECDTILNRTVSNRVITTLPLDEALFSSSGLYNRLSWLKKENFRDLEIHTGNTSFPVHKSVLCARFPIFKSSFTTDKENVSGPFYISDVDTDTLCRILQFVYTEKTGDLQWESAVKLYSAADKYQILPLKKICSSYLKANVNYTRANDTLLLAKRCNDKELELAADVILHRGVEIDSLEKLKLRLEEVRRSKARCENEISELSKDGTVHSLDWFSQDERSFVSGETVDTEQNIKDSEQSFASAKTEDDSQSFADECEEEAEQCFAPEKTEDTEQSFAAENPARSFIKEEDTDLSFIAGEMEDERLKLYTKPNCVVEKQKTKKQKSKRKKLSSFGSKIASVVFDAVF